MNNITSIKSDSDLDKALEEARSLWECKPDTPESDRLDILVTMIEEYEDVHYPIK